MQREIGAALKVGFRGEELQVDVAMAEGTAFVAMAGIGLDAAVVRSTPRVLKEHLGWVAYAAGAIAHLGSVPHELTLCLDGGEPIARQAHSVVIGNVGILPGGFAILPGARLDDGLLDVGVLAPDGWFGWGRHPPGPGRRAPRRPPVRALQGPPRRGQHGDRAPARTGRGSHRAWPFAGRQHRVQSAPRPRSRPLAS